MTTSTTPRTHYIRRTPIYIHIAAWSVPALILGQFALVAALPIAIMLVATQIDRRIRGLRHWADALAVGYLIPLVIWLVQPDRAPSLSKDMAPGFVALTVALSVLLLIKIYTRKRKTASEVVAASANEG
jgi:hypothetical protein